MTIERMRARSPTGEENSGGLRWSSRRVYSSLMKAPSVTSGLFARDLAKLGEQWRAGGTEPGSSVLRSTEWLNSLCHLHLTSQT